MGALRQRLRQRLGGPRSGLGLGRHIQRAVTNARCHPWLRMAYHPECHASPPRDTAPQASARPR